MATEVELQPVPDQMKLDQGTEFQPPNVPLENNVQGQVNPAFQGQENQAFQGEATDESAQQKEAESELSLPPMTHIDFLPLKFEDAVSPDDCPRYAEFR